MSDEKLDLILTVVSDMKLKVENLGTRFDRLDTKVDNLETGFDRLNTKADNLETGFDRLNTKVDNLDSEFKGFKKQVIESFTSIQNRIGVLEKQMVAIGVEVKSEIKAEIEIVGKQIDRLEEEILLNRTDTLSNRRKIKDFEARLTRLENHVGITV